MLGGAPVVGAEIELRPSSKEWPDARALAPRTARTDAGGRFSLDKLAEVDWSISIAAPASVVYRNQVDLRTRKGFSDWTVELAPGLTRVGTVLDAGGKPVAGVRINDGRGERVTTDRGGKFTLRHLQRNESLPLLAEAANGAVASGRLDVNDEPPPVLKLGPPNDPHVLRLRVVDPSGKPVAGALISIHGDKTVELGASDADGRRIAIAGDPKLHISVIQRPFKDASVDLAFPYRGTTTITLKLP
jgi:hypothetical protein